MKECDKQWNNYTMPGDRKSHQYSFRAGWVEALEWALTQGTDLQHTELGAAVKRELGDRK